MTDTPEATPPVLTPREFIEKEVAGLSQMADQHRDQYNHIKGAMAAYESILARMDQTPKEIEQAIADAPNVEKLDDHRGKGKDKGQKLDPVTPELGKDPA